MVYLLLSGTSLFIICILYAADAVKSIFWQLLFFPNSFLCHRSEPGISFLFSRWLRANERIQHCHQQMHHQITQFCLTWFLASVCYFCQTQSNWVLIFDANPLWSFQLWCKPDLTSRLSKARSQWPNFAHRTVPYLPVLFPFLVSTQIDY